AGRPKDDCGFTCIEHPAGVAVNSQEGERLFTLNGIQTMSGRIGNLVGDLDDVAASGVDLLRISPGLDAAEVVAAFDRARRGEPCPPFDDDRTGYWHGRPGMTRVPGGMRGGEADALA